ncbi:ost-hth associated domain protein [Cystoisospora suis]|uniref:Ost-hth associated domain protein n=1 Tax=Cystoisospora suis TaxID=483139 RepID=A0A2C6KPS2_9APIC|nr:ost-hth associated domain protein [Cystoisospora suis]
MVQTSCSVSTRESVSTQNSETPPVGPRTHYGTPPPSPPSARFPPGSSYTSSFPTPVEAYYPTAPSCPPPSPWQRRNSPRDGVNRPPRPPPPSGKFARLPPAPATQGRRMHPVGPPVACPKTKAIPSPPSTPKPPLPVMVHSKPHGLFGPVPKSILKEGIKQRIAGVDVLRLADGSVLPRIDGSNLQHLLYTNPRLFPELAKALTDCVLFLYKEGIKPFAGEIAHQMRKRTEGGSWLPSEVVALAVAAQDLSPRVERRVKGEDGWVILLKESQIPASFDGFVDTRAREDCYTAEQWLAFNRYFIEKMRSNVTESTPGGSTALFIEGRYALAERLRQEIPMFRNMKLAHLIRMVQLASWKKLLTYRDKALVPVAACPVAAKECAQRNSFSAPGSENAATAHAAIEQLLRALSRIVDPEPTGVFLAQLKDLVRWTTYERLDCMILGHTKLQDLLLSEPFNRYYRLYTPEGNEHCTYVQSKRYALPWGGVLHTRCSMLWDPEGCPMMESGGPDCALFGCWGTPPSSSPDQDSPRVPEHNRDWKFSSQFRAGTFRSSVCLLRPDNTEGCPPPPSLSVPPLRASSDSTLEKENSDDDNLFQWIEADVNRLLDDGSPEIEGNEVATSTLSAIADSGDEGSSTVVASLDFPSSLAEKSGDCQPAEPTPDNFLEAVWFPDVSLDKSKLTEVPVQLSATQGGCLPFVQKFLMNSKASSASYTRAEKNLDSFLENMGGDAESLPDSCCYFRDRWAAGGGSGGSFFYGTSLIAVVLESGTIGHRGEPPPPLDPELTKVSGEEEMPLTPSTDCDGSQSMPTPPPLPEMSLGLFHSLSNDDENEGESKFGGGKKSTSDESDSSQN